MGSKQELFERFFGSNENDGKVILNSTERSVAQLAYMIASKSIHEGPEDSNVEPDDDPDDEPSDDNYDDDPVFFDKRIETAMDNFNRVVELFKLSRNAKTAFVANFDHWSSLRKNNVRRLKEIADEIQTDKFNSDIAKVVGGVVGVAGGIVAGLSFLTPLAVVTIPLAISGGIATAVGGGVVVGTTGTEIVLLKNKLEEAKTLAEQEEENFSTMAQWFEHTQDLKNALESLIDCDLLNEMAVDLKEFDKEVKDNLGSLKDNFRKVLTTCIEKMCKQSKIVELFGAAFAPVVMTFVLVVCLVRDHNRIVLDCILQVERFAVGMMSALGIGVQTGRLTLGLATKGAAAAGRAASVAIAASVFVALGVVVDVVNVVLSSIDIHNRPELEHAKQIKEAAERLDEEFSFIEKVYEELNKWKSIDWASVKEWKTFIISHVPGDAVHIDIKMAVKPYISDEALGCIMLQRDSNDGNDWLVKIPASYSHMLLRQSHLIIKGQSCQVKQWTRWKTFIVHHIPDGSEQEDIQIAVRSHLPEEAWNSIKFQRLSTDGNNWIVKVPSRHSENLVQQSHIIVKRERCLVTL